MKLKDNSTQEIDTALYQLEQRLKSNIRLTDVENSNASTAKINAVDKKLTEEVKDRQSADEKLQDNINKYESQNGPISLGGEPKATFPMGGFGSGKKS